MKLSQIREVIVKQLPEKIKTFPIPDSHLNGAAVLACSLIDAAELVDDLQHLKAAYAKQIGALSLVLKAFCDLFLEITDHQSHRQWLAKQINLAEREAARMRLPSWVWRIDQAGDIRAQLSHRAAFLKEEAKAHPDDQWDTLCEVLKLAGLELDESLLRSVITGGSDANS